MPFRVIGSFPLACEGEIPYTAQVPRMRLHILPILLLACSTWSPAAPQLRERRIGSVPQAVHPWWKSVQSAIMSIQRHGSGRYSTSEQAKQALVSSFRWNEHYRRPQLNALAARPSFCSSAVWVATLSALLQWEEKNRRRVISPEAWQALLPHLEKDGIGPWGYANANGPGFALLVHKLGAGFSFTDWKKARPSDVLKIWWNDHIGGQERGHIVILVRDEGDTACVWSSHMEKDGQPGGYGIRRYPKSAMKRVLFTRITQPAAFNRASKLPDDPWLTRLMTENTTWAECVRRCGIWH